MAGFKLNLFKGIRPRISPLKLPEGEALTAENVDLGSGDLEPWFDKGTEQAVSPGRNTRTIYRFDNASTPLWLEWDDYVDVARGPVKGDELERTYYTGDSTGTGAPKMTNIDLVGNSGGPYPEGWVYIGVPAPGTAPTITTQELPEDVPVEDRFVPTGGLQSAEFLIDNVNYTIYPGTGTENDQWTPNAAASGAIKFDVETGKSFRVTEVINANKVKLESASEPGIFAKTFSPDKSTINDWNPFDEGGTTQEAEFVGWRIPVGIETTIAGHKLQVGDIITVTAVSTPLSFSTGLSTIHYGQSWLTPTLKDELGVSFYNVPDARISASAVSGDTLWDITGSFYYDVDRTASTSQVEDRTYVYTYVTDNGEEGPPSPPSAVTPTLDGSLVYLENLELPPTIGYNITSIRVYRTNSTVAGTEFQFVKEVPVTTLTTDAVPSEELGEVLNSTTWDPPHPDMIGITEMPNGMLVGFRGKNIYFCEPYFPHAWPAEYDQAIGFEIVGLANLGNSIAVMTKGPPYILTGAHPRNANIRSTKVNQACLSKESIATDGDNVYYASPDGLVEISVNGIRVATENYIEKKDWNAYDPSTMVGGFHEGRYYGFYDFDVNFIDPVISAEVSGTIAVANELDIVTGGRTIILTLTNDNWVAAGASFDNQRQAIIDGLTASTGQSLGWNAEVRDTALQVTDVVRTNDSIVTITLPVVPGYEITANEVIQPTIPAAALLISNVAVPTGSTFTVTAQTPEQSVQIGGTIAGAAEGSIVTGGDTVTLTLTNDVWVDGVDFDAQRQSIIDGLISTTDEQDGWNDLVPNLIPITNVVRTSDLQVTITLPAVANYDITADESIYALVPATSVVAAGADLVTLNSVAIIADGIPSAQFGGSIMTSIESEIVAGGNQITITLVNDTWIAAGTGPIGTTAQSQSLVDALIATTSQTFGWNNVVRPGIEAHGAGVDLVRTSATVATITLDAEATYSLGTSETVGATIPNDLLVTSTSDLLVSNTFGITSESPTTCFLSGTITNNTDENDIVAGGRTIVLTLSNDTWVAAGATFDAERANIIAGITSAQSEGTGWNAVVRDVGIDVDDVVRTNDSVVTITLDPEATYNITADEFITTTVPASALSLSSVAVVASIQGSGTTFTVFEDQAANIIVSGTALTATSDDIITGGRTIILTVENDQWVNSGAAFNAIRQSIIDGLDAATSPTDGWNNIMRDLEIGVGDVVRTNNTVVTITLPAAPAYDINANEVITVTVPTFTLLQESSPVIGSPTITITASETFNSRIYVYEDNQSQSGRDPTFHVSHYNPDHWTDISPALAGTDDAILSVGWLDGVGAGDGRLVAGWFHVNDLPTFDFEGTIRTSDDDGVTWTERTDVIPTSNIAEGFPQKIHVIDTADGVICFNIVEPAGAPDRFQYSVDGITWAEITAAIGANFVEDSNDVFIDMLYGGNHVYLHNGNKSELVPSADLSGANTVANDWLAPISQPTPANPGLAFSALHEGRGKLLCVQANTTGGYDLQWMAYGGSSFSTASSDMPSASLFGNPSYGAYGDNKRLILDPFGKGWMIDTDGQAAGYDEDPSNWTVVDFVTEIIGSVYDIWYDSEIGFVVVSQLGSPFFPANGAVYVTTSTDLVTWTQRKAFDVISFTSNSAVFGRRYTSRKDIRATNSVLLD